MAKILILTGDAAEDLEVMYPYQRLLEEGYEVHIAAPTKKKLQFVVHDFVDGFDTYTEKPGHSWPADLAFADVDPSEYAAVVVPGGRAALAAAGTLTGRRSAAYPALALDVAAAGAEFVDSEAVVDGVMVSARAWPDHPAWMREFVSILRAKAPAH